MDYQYYRGDSDGKLPKLIQKLVPWYKPIGIVMCVLSLVFPMLMVTHTIKSTGFLNCLSFLFNFYGVVLWIYGHSLTKVSKMKDEELSQEILDYYNKKRNKIDS